MPAKNSPTSLGSAALEPGEKEELQGEQLEAFLKLHNLLHMKDMDGIGWRAKKLQFALEKNPKLIKPELDQTKQRQLKEMLIETAACLATKIEDLKEPCKVDPVDIPTSSPPIKQKAFKLSPTDIEFL